MATTTRLTLDELNNEVKRRGLDPKEIEILIEFIGSKHSLPTTFANKITFSADGRKVFITAMEMTR